MMAKSLLLAASMAGYLTLAGQQDEGPNVSPTRVCPLDEILIDEPTGLNLSLAVRTPDGKHIILAAHRYATMLPFYWTNHSVRLKASDVIGFDYDDGRPYIRPLFTQAGVYEFYFAENLATERDNTIAFSIFVTFMGHDNPDCPKSPPD